MALVAVAMTCGDGVRCTDSIGGCNSYAKTNIGIDSQFRGPKFSIMYRLKLVNGALTTGGARVGIADLNGATRRQYLQVTVAGSLFHLIPTLDTTSCGFQIVADETKPKDVVEHSVAWTYDQTGQSILYWDGVVVVTQAAPCANILNPAAASDVFQIAGSTQFAGTEVFNIDRVMYTNEIMPASQILSIHQNCGSF